MKGLRYILSCNEEGGLAAADIMNKKLTALITAVIATTALTACRIEKINDTEASAEPTATPVATASAEPEATTAPWEINSFTEGVPMVTFGTLAFESEGDFYLVMYDDVRTEALETYKKLLAEAGYTQTNSEEGDLIKYTFANTNGKTVSVEYSAGTMTVSIANK